MKNIIPIPTKETAEPQPMDIYVSMVEYYDLMARLSPPGQLKDFYEHSIAFWARLGLVEQEAQAQSERALGGTELRCPTCERMVSRRGYCFACRAEGQDWRGA